MSDRRLVVGEFDPLDANNGKLFALAPSDATGVGIPSFKVGTARPLIGGTVGEGYYDTNQRQGFVWTGSAWEGIAPNPIMTYDTEAELTADLAPRLGTYATAGNTGSLFVKAPTGWRQVGIKQYPTAIDLFGDRYAAIGALGEVEDEGSLWEMSNTGWRLLVIREMSATDEILAWDESSDGANIGDRAVDAAHDVVYIRTSNGWRPTTLWTETEVNIRAATWVIDGQEAIANDTGRTFVRVYGEWVEEPIQHYDTEVLLLAATVPNGVLAWADDTNVVFTRAAGTWHRLQGPQITVGETAPTTPGTGDQWLQPSASRLEVWGGAAWIAPHSGAKLIARRNLDFHHFAGDAWEDVVNRWFKPASAGAKLGNLIMVVMTINVVKYHTGSIKLSSRVRLDTATNAVDGGWTEYNSAGTSHETSAGVSSIFVGKIDDVDARLFYSASTFGAGGGNGDRQGWGYVAVWDMGPENMPGIDPM